MEAEDDFCGRDSLQCPMTEIGEMTFDMMDYIKDAMKALEMMRCHDMLTDVLLEVGTETFRAHRVVLAAGSPYFKAMFTGGLKESDMNKITLQGVSATAMSRLIDFMYTGKIKVTENTVCQLLPAAALLQVTNVIKACCDFLEKQLDPSNAIGLATFAELHGCTEFYKKANQYIERHFSQICQEEEFFQLTVRELLGLIKRDELNVQDEKEVYNAVLKWVKFDQEKRQPKMELILSAVRCQFLSPRFLNEQMKNCEMIKKTPACKEYLEKIFRDLTLHKKSNVKERTPNIPRVIFIAGGYHNRHSIDVLEAYNVDTKVWQQLHSLTVPRSGLGGAFLNGIFYAVGGRHNVREPREQSCYDSDWVDKYYPMKDVWRPCNQMSVPRSRVGVAAMDGLLYAVGGGAGANYHNTVEYYDPEIDMWKPVASMHYKRLAMGVVVVNRLLYAIGGFDGTGRLNSVECYHPENNAWTLVEPMKIPRSGAGVAAMKQFIYVIGGYDGSNHLNSVERYDTENRKWEFVSTMKIARSALTVTVLDCKLYAMGGYDGEALSQAVEIYDPVADKWEDGVPLTFGRSGHASAVCYQLPCNEMGFGCDGK